MSKAHWLALSSVSGIGGVTARKLINRFGDVASVFAAAPEQLATVARVTPVMAKQLLAVPVEKLEEELLSLDDAGIELLTWDDKQFPSSLRDLPDAPVVLFMRGSLNGSDRNSVAIVGTRAPTPHASQTAFIIALELASRGLTIVSGFAQGIDTLAHRGALLSADGHTIGVLGNGINVIHPPENAALAEQVIRRGALLSELHPNAPPRGPQLMARDRIISGLSRAVIVVEAGIKSGSLDTAARAIKQGRAVFAVPGSEGTDKLLADGAQTLDPDAVDYEGFVAELAAARSPGTSITIHQDSFL